jgi:hypothetical protein
MNRPQFGASNKRPDGSFGGASAGALQQSRRKSAEIAGWPAKLAL